MTTKIEMKRRQKTLNKRNKRDKRSIKTQAEIDKKIVYLDNKGNRKEITK